MLNNTSWLWKAKAEQHGWGDRSVHFAWEMHRNRGKHRWSQGRFCYLALCCPFIKRRRGPWVMSVFCFFSSIAVHCYAHSYSAVAESFPTTEYKWICVDYSCGEQTCVWPRGFLNFVSPFQNPLSTCAFLIWKKVTLVLWPQTHSASSSLYSGGHECWTTGSYCLSLTGWRSDLIVSCSWKKLWSLSSGLFWMLAFQFTFR